MSSIEIVSPTIVDGIEFYVSTDGKHCGVSQVGLARLCGVGESGIRSLLTKLGGSSVRTVEAKNLLKDLKGKDLYLALGSNQQAKIINGKVAARIIRYFAFESVKQTDEAKFSLGKFAEIGIDTWIKEVTGFAESNDIAGMFKSISSQLNLMASEITEMKVQLIQTEGYRAARVELGGLREWMEGIEAKEFLEASKNVDEAEPVYTLKAQWSVKTVNGHFLLDVGNHFILVIKNYLDK